MSRKERITKKLEENITIDFLNIIDESYLHAHHKEGGGSETHFKIEIKSKDFAGNSRVQNHKIINNLLKEEFDSGLHALSIKFLL